MSKTQDAKRSQGTDLFGNPLKGPKLNYVREPKTIPTYEFSPESVPPFTRKQVRVLEHMLAHKLGRWEMGHQNDFAKAEIGALNSAIACLHEILDLQHGLDGSQGRERGERAFDDEGRLKPTSRLAEFLGRRDVVKTDAAQVNTAGEQA